MIVADRQRADGSTHRRPESVLVIVYTDSGEVLLLRRRRPFGFWQSVTGSLAADESHDAAAERELLEETGLTGDGGLSYSGRSRTFEIDPSWQHRFAPGVTENLEYEWRYRMPCPADIRLNPEEHSAYRWLPVDEAVDIVWSWTNREALAALGRDL